MRVSLNTAINRINFQSKVKNVVNGTLTDDLKDKIDVFEETHSNAKELGSGLFATAYLLNGTNYVIKESLDFYYAKKQNGNFYNEAQALSMLPDKMNNTQKLVARAQTEKGNYYLISTFVNGNPAKFTKKDWNKSAFDSLFTAMEKLDEANIYHNDLNEANCLIDKNNQTGIIDYQFAEKYLLSNNSTNSEKYKTPSFMMPANAQMFEMASLPYYLMDMKGIATKKDIRNLFKMYIKAKSTYALNRSTYLIKEKAPKDKIEYEKLQEKFYNNPSEDMIDLQAKKLQIMYSFRKTFSILDKNVHNDKNMFLAIPYYLFTAACAKNMVDKAEDMKKNTEDEDLKKFLDYEISFGNYWKIEMLKELNIFGTGNDEGVWPWIIRNAQLSPKHITEEVVEDDYIMGPYNCIHDYGVPEGEDISDKLKVSETLPIREIYTVSDIICNDNNTQNITNPFKDGLFEDEIKSLTEQISNTKIMPKDENISKLIDYLVLREKYIKGCKKAIAALKEKKLNAAITNAVMAEYYRNILMEELEKFDSNSDKEFYAEQIRLLNTNKLILIAKSTAKEIIACINSDEAQPNLLENMTDLDVVNY